VQESGGVKDFSIFIGMVNITNNLERYDIISFDVFDTLIFRACYEPSEVFELVGKEMAKTQNWYYAPISYKNLRIVAEQRAREKKGLGIDCTFEEIFCEFPFSNEVKNELMQLEIKCEKNVQFLNQSIYSLLVDFFGKGKKIFIVSNMYYSGKQILDFLRSAGVDDNLISKIYVSSEQGCYKDSGKLFKCMLDDNPDVPPNRVLHIGDNEKADIIGAKNAGINSVHYNVTNNKFGSIYDFERLKYNPQLGEIYAIRKLSTANNPYDDENLKVFYNFGAEVIGPLYTLFAEWIIRYAKKRNANIVLAFMREGELLSNVINRAAKASNSDVVSVPTYISRHPAFMASIFEENYEERLSVLFRRNELTTRQLLKFFDIDVSNTPFADKSDIAINELILNDRSNLKDYLHSDDVRQNILLCSKNNRELLLRYIKSITNGKVALSVDIGFKGTTQFFLNDIFLYGEWEQKLYHSLMMGVSQTSILNIFNKADIITWLGFLGENEQEIGVVYRNPLLIECLVNSTCGSTCAYKDDNGTVVPLLEDTIFDNTRIKFVEAVWEGIENFQVTFLSVTKTKPYMTQNLLERKKDFLNILCRFMQCPSIDEAKIIGGISYEDTFLNQKFEPFAGEMPSSKLTESEIVAFLSRARIDGTYWPEAACKQVYPQYSLKKIISDLGNINMLYSDIFRICEKIKESKFKAGYIFCAAPEVCEKFCEFANLFEIELKGIIDSDKRLHGSIIRGLKIMGINEINEIPDFFFVASYVYGKEVSRIIVDKYSGQICIPKIFLLGEEYD